MNEPMKVLGLKAKNLRNIEIVEVDLKDKEFIEITGDNGAAKSTLIDVIFGAMIGKTYFGGAAGAWQVIKSGENKATMKVTLGNKERQVEVTRSITKLEKDDKPTTAGGSLKIEDTNGEALGQDFLNSLISVFTVDVKRFAELPIKEQTRTVYDMLGVNVEEIDEKIKDQYIERTSIGRQLKSAQGKAEGLKCDEIESVSVEDLIVERQEIDAYNQNEEEKGRQFASRNDDYARLVDRIATYQEGLDDLRYQVQVAEADIEKMEISKTEFAKELEAMPQASPAKSTAAVDESMRNAADINNRAQQYVSYIAAQKEAETLGKLYEKETKDIDTLKAKKDAALKSGKLPFKNLSIDDTLGLMIGDVPFTQKSSAEQIRISAQIGMKLKPDLRVLCIRSGSLLDQESFDVVRKLSEHEGYQVLIESVGEKPGENQIVLRAGQVISEFEEQQTAAEIAKGMNETL